MSSKKPCCWSNEYFRRGTRTVQPCLNVTTRQVSAHVSKDPQSKTFLKFVDSEVRENKGKRLHAVLDNLNIHNKKAALRWLEGNPSVSFHLTPTHALCEPEQMLFFDPDEAGKAAGRPPVGKRTERLPATLHQRFQPKVRSVRLDQRSRQAQKHHSADRELSAVYVWLKLFG